MSSLSSPPILYEDRFLIVVNKPAGLHSQSPRDRREPDLYSELQKERPYVGLHHRLDRNTSGAILFTVSRDANRGIAELFREGKIQKTYLALVRLTGNMPDTWKVENQLRKEGRKMVSVRSGGDIAQTEFQLKQRLNGIALVEARPLTGRMHQIRTHLAESHRPILGDRLYGTGDPVEYGRVRRPMLHAASLEFIHPLTGETLRIEAPLPADFVEAQNQDWSS